MNRPHRNRIRGFAACTALTPFLAGCHELVLTHLIEGLRDGSVAAAGDVVGGYFNAAFNLEATDAAGEDEHGHEEEDEHAHDEESGTASESGSDLFTHI